MSLHNTEYAMDSLSTQCTPLPFKHPQALGTLLNPQKKTQETEFEHSPFSDACWVADLKIKS